MSLSQHVRSVNMQEFAYFFQSLPMLEVYNFCIVNVSVPLQPCLLSIFVMYDFLQRRVNIVFLSVWSESSKWAYHYLS